MVSIKNSKLQSASSDLQDSRSNARATELSDLSSFSQRDKEFIVKFREEHGSDVFRQILQSICPSIYGHELVKGISIFVLLKSLPSFVLICFINIFSNIICFLGKCQMFCVKFFSPVSSSVLQLQK